MRFLSFLLEREGGQPLRRPLGLHPTVRLQVTAHFWGAGEEPHTLEVVTRQPDGVDQVVGTFTAACSRGDGLFTLGGPLLPLKQGGWHRLYLRIDGHRIVVSTPLFVLGPRKKRGVYMGRDQLGAVPAEPTPPASVRDRDDDVERKVGGPRR